MTFSRPLKSKEKETYIYICEMIFGGVPVDVDWAMNTELYKNYKFKNYGK